MYRKSTAWIVMALMVVSLTPLLAPFVGSDPPDDTGWLDPILLDTRGGGADLTSLAMASTGHAFVVWREWGVGSQRGLYARQFVPEGGWQAATRLVEAPDQVELIEVAISANGSAIATWERHDPVSQCLVVDAALYDPAAGWGDPVSVLEEAQCGYRPAVAMDAEGNAVLVWTQDGDVVFARQYRSDAGWEGAVPLSAGRQSAWDPQVAMDPAGRILATWTGRNGIYAARFVPGTGWGTQTPIHVTLGSMNPPQLAVDSEGRGVVAWSEWLDGESEIHTIRFEPATGWGSDHLMERGNVRAPQVAIDPSGTAIVAWEQDDGIYASRSVSGLGWGPATALHLSIGSVNDPQLAVDRQGNATVVWAQRNGGGSRIHASHFAPLDGWSSPVIIDAASGSWSPTVAMDGEGDAIAVWIGWDDPYQRVYANHFRSGLSWGSADPIGAGPLGADSPRIATNARGETIIVWIDRTRDGCLLYAKSSSPTSGWMSGTSISNGIARACGSLDVAMDGFGNGIAVWTEGEGEAKQVYVNRFVSEVGWGTAFRISRGTSPRVALDMAGNAFAVWALGGRILAGRFTPETGWSDPVGIEALTSSTIHWEGAAGPPEVAMDLEGNGVVVWIQGSYSRESVYARRYLVGTGWQEATRLGGGRVDELQLEVDLDGNAFAMWESYGNVIASRLDEATGWDDAKAIAKDVTGDDLHLALDHAGNALAVWMHYQDDGGGKTLYAARYDVRSGWGAPVPINGGLHAGNVYAWSPIAAMDSRGNAVVVWEQWDTTGSFWWYVPLQYRNVYANRFVLGGGWGTAIRLASGAWSPRVVMDGGGNAIAVWDQPDGIFANRFVRGNGAPDLTILSPTPVLQTHSQVHLRGMTDPGATVTVDGSETPVDVRGHFTITKTLPEGTHSLEVVATNPVGRTQTILVDIAVDMTAPVLSIMAPEEGIDIDLPTITVIGATDVGAHLVVNGVVVAVRPDGTFSTRVSLVDGINVIDATSTDAAGNQATVSVEIRYINPAQSLRLTTYVQTMFIGILMAAIAVLTILHVGPRNLARMLGLGTASRGSRNLEGPAQRRFPWPTTATGDPLGLTSKERILVHLLDFAQYNGRQEVPPDLTQPGIAAVAGVDLRHFAQYIRPLVREGLVREGTERVTGVLKRRKVYLLTESGMRRALGIRERVLSVKVRIREVSGERDATIAEALAKESRFQSILDIVHEAVLRGTVDVRP